MFGLVEWRGAGERCGAREILFASLTEEDILHPDRPIDLRVVSKP